MPYKSEAEAREYRRSYYLKNKERMNAASHALYVDNRAERLKYARRRNADPKIKASRKKYAKKRWKDPEVRRKAKDSILRRNFGITLACFDAMLIAQSGTCAICDRQFKNHKHEPMVDHCHATKRVRGLLCHFCNIALGAFRDDQVILLSAIEYLMP
jgi:hypothetical protein